MNRATSLRRASGKRILKPLMALGVLFLVGCSNLVYLTGHKVLPLPANTVLRTPIYRQGDWIVARGSLHNHSTFSDGVHPPEDLLELARREGIAVMAVTDHREGGIKIQHGPRIPVNGIERVGYQAYFDRLRPLREASRQQGLIVLIGAEVNPYLYNYGKKPHFVVAYQNRHIVVYGIDDPKVFQEMPAWREVSIRRPEHYHGLENFQTFVDYVRDHGGITTAAHVESQEDLWFGPAHFFDTPPINHVRDLKHLTTFSILPEGYHELAGGAGGIWDTTLLEYLMGMRDQAPWCVGDADYHGPEESPAWSSTLFYLKQFNEPDVYAALREGRTLALMGRSFQDSYVAEFSVSQAGQKPKDPIMFAQTVTVASPPVIRFSLNHDVPETKTRLIRNGKVILEKEGTAFEFTDREMFAQKMPAYYRVEVKGPALPKAEQGAYAPESEIFTNPIFVKFYTN
jgi:hypothetical protein